MYTPVVFLHNGDPRNFYSICASECGYDNKIGEALIITFFASIQVAVAHAVPVINTKRGEHG